MLFSRRIHERRSNDDKMSRCTWFRQHIWQEYPWKNTAKRTCTRCGTTEYEVWDDFSSYYWIPIPMTKDDLIVL